MFDQLKKQVPVNSKKIFIRKIFDMNFLGL